MAAASWLEACRAGARWDAPVQQGGLEDFEQEYELDTILGRGGFGEVFLARSKSSGVEVAVKVLHSAAGQTEEAIKEEIRTMSRVSSTYSVSVIEAFAPSEGLGDGCWRIVLEFCSGCELDKILREKGALGLEGLRSVAAQLGTAVLHIHSCGVVHRDLKPGNVMVEGGDVDGGSTRIKLIDFGLAVAMDKSFERRYVRNLAKKTKGRVFSMRRAEGAPERMSSNKSGDQALATSNRSLDSGATTDGELATKVSLSTFEALPAGTRAYAAPELLAPGSAGSAMSATVSVDAYALGCIMKYCATGVPPEEDVSEFISSQTGNPIILLMRLVRTCRGLPVPQYRYMSGLPEEVRELVKGLMARDPEKRLTVTQLCESDYVAKAPGLRGNPFTEPEPKEAVPGEGADAAEAAEDVPTV